MASSSSLVPVGPSPEKDLLRGGAGEGFLGVENDDAILVC